MLPVKYQQFYDDLRAFLPEQRLFTDPLRTLAYGTDASFYRLIPKIVIKADSETEVARILQTADSRNIPMTFRAAGTSLSGQSIEVRAAQPDRLLDRPVCLAYGDHGDLHGGSG